MANWTPVAVPTAHDNLAPPPITPIAEVVSAERKIKKVKHSWFRNWMQNEGKILCHGLRRAFSRIHSENKYFPKSFLDNDTFYIIEYSSPKFGQPRLRLGEEKKRIEMRAEDWLSFRARGNSIMPPQSFSEIFWSFVQSFCFAYTRNYTCKCVIFDCDWFRSYFKRDSTLENAAKLSAFFLNLNRNAKLSFLFLEKLFMTFSNIE